MKNLKRITALLLAMTLVLTNFVGIGSYLIGGLEVYATETETLAELGIDKSNLSTSVDNEVRLTITLHTEEENYDLFKNPSFIIEFPKEITDVEVTGINVININEEYELSDVTIEEASGKKRLTFDMDWEQLQRATSLSSNVQINIDAVLTPEELIPTTTGTISLTYTNEAGTAGQDNNLEVNLVSETGILLATTIDANGQEARSFKTNTGTLMVHKDSASIQAQVTATIINNTDNDLTNVKILGLAENVSAINFRNITAYYTENENPTIDLNDPSNGWTSTYGQGKKAYLLEIPVIEARKMIEYTYSVTLTEAKNYEVEYTVYADGMTQKESSAEIRAITTVGQIGDLEARIETKIMKKFFDIDHIENGAKVTYDLYVKNTKSQTRSLEIVFSKPYALEFKTAKICQENTFELEGETYSTFLPQEVIQLNKDPQQKVDMSLGAGEELLLRITTDVTSYRGDQVVMQFSVVDGNKEQILTDTQTALSPADISSTIDVYKGQAKIQDGDTIELIEGDTLRYEITLTNAGTAPGSVDVDYELPENMDIILITYLDGSNNILGQTEEYFGNDYSGFVEIPGSSTKKIVIEAKNKTEIQTPIEVTDTEVSVVSDEMSLTVPVVDYTMIGQAGRSKKIQLIENGDDNNNETIEEPEENELENNENNEEGLKGETIEEQPEETIEDPVAEGNKEENVIEEGKKEITTEENRAEETVTGEETEEEKTETEKQEEQEEPKKDIEVEIKKYSISGLAWLDKNYNGMRDEEEPLLKGIKVNLYETSSDVIIKYTLTDENGEYKFTDLLEGEYIVSFEYDSVQYNVTKSPTDAPLDINSDVVVTTQGTTTTTKTDKIALTNSLEHIDIGLVLKDSFDLQIDKYIKQVVVKNEEGTLTTAFKDNSNFGKVEIPAKAFKGSVVVITYNIVITNKGKVAAQVSSILDEKPEGLTFSSEINKDWYETDGKLYNIVLADEIIEPGKTKAVELVLTREITEDSKVTVKNTAKINQSFNEYLLEEKDLNNNSAEAELLITIKTGGEVVYIGLALACLMIVSIGIYVINKKVLN